MCIITIKALSDFKNVLHEDHDEDLYDYAENWNQIIVQLRNFVNLILGYSMVSAMYKIAVSL